MKKEVLLVLTDRWCDWEAGYATATLNFYSKDEFKVKSIAIDKQHKESMGGLRAEVDYTFEEYHGYDNLALVILAGGLSWGENAYDEIAQFVKEAASLRIPVAAICGATTFLGKHGFLNSVWHTGVSREALLSQPGYNGQALYVDVPAVTDGGFITANETAAVDFAYEIFKTLNFDSMSERHEWYERFSKRAASY